MAQQDGSLVLTASQHELDLVLEEDGDIAAKIKEEVQKGTLHRTQLWKYRTGHDRPGHDLTALFERLSGGRIAVGGWARGTLPTAKPRRHAARASR